MADAGPFEIGLRIGPYEITETVGSGGMGCVYLATDHSLGDRQVVIKTIRAVPGVDPSTLEARFTREARTLARLHHPHVVGVFAAGVHEGQPYLVMEFVPGRDLTAYVEEVACLAEPDRLARLVRVMAQVARGVEHAHARGVVHRDLKPSNVLIRAEDDDAVILDFGIARAKGDVQLTVGPQMPGTLAYEAPEQLDVSRKQSDEAIDVWALGVMLYRLLAGAHPFRGDDAVSLAHAILTIEPPHPHQIRASVPIELEAIALECLEKDPSARPASAADVATRLERWLEHPASRAPIERPPKAPTELATAILLTPDPSRVAPRRLRYAGAIGLLLVGGILAVAGLSGFGPFAAAFARLWGRTAPAARPPAAATDSVRTVAIPAGPFEAGCPEDAEIDCGAPVAPQSVVDLGAFRIDETPVTVADFERCVRQERCSANGLRMPYFLGEEQPEAAAACNWGVSGRARHPINCVSWTQADEFCRWMGKRLPTSAEWEKAARGTDGRLYPWGNQGFDGEKRANIADESSRGALSVKRILRGYDDGYAGTSPVGSFPEGASPYGVLDMVGNVREWVADEHDERREVRGASWRSSAETANAVYRRLLEASDRSSGGGFRCAEDPAEPSDSAEETR